MNCSEKTPKNSQNGESPEIDEVDEQSATSATTDQRKDIGKTKNDSRKTGKGSLLFQG